MSNVSWPITEAKRILKAHPDPSQAIHFETGYGPSGLPHIGTFGEVARTLFVIKALNQLEPNRKTRLFVFSDDMDGLRNLPENIPNHDLLRPHLGAPLTSIPDPFGTQTSFAHYMNAKLKEFLDSFGFEYEFRSSTECYQSGLFDEGLKKVMDHYDQIREQFIATIAKDKREAWSPFFPICENCGKIYSTKVTEIHPESYELSYQCNQSAKLWEPCGHQGKISILGGNVKLGWKVDWALRWWTLKIGYEMYGKDLMESANMSAKLCRIMGGKPPVAYKYELFLDENGAKISKKIGNGVSMGQWIKYAPLQALLNFLLGNPNKAKKMGLPILARLIDEYLQVARSASADPQSPGWFIQQIQNQSLSDEPKLKSELSYALLYNVAESLGLKDQALLFDYAMRYDDSVAQNQEFYQDLCAKVIAFASDYHDFSDEALEVDRSMLPLLDEIEAEINRADETLDADQIQQFIFTLSREKELNQRQWFKFLYQTLLGKDQGPKMGPFFAVMGKQKALELIGRAKLRYRV